MKAKAVRKYIRSSPRKIRPLANVVRGQRVPDAINSLTFLPQMMTDEVRRTIMSAVHNLMDQNQEERFDEEQLIVREIRVDEGPHFKRFRPAPRGRAQPILKRTSHLTVVVGTPGDDEDDE